MLKLTSLGLTNILSFGPAETRLAINDLNVLIGTNASGKSNVIDVLHLLHSLPGDATTAIREGGGVREWMWKGQQDAVARVEVTLERTPGPLRHWFEFAPDGPRWTIRDERVEDAAQTAAVVHFDHAAATNLRRDQSVLAQRPDPSLDPELALIRQYYGSFRIYRDWTLGRRSEIRRPQPADLPYDLLDVSGQNLAVMLDTLLRQETVADELNAHMRRFYEGFQEIVITSHGDLLQINVVEEGRDTPIPAARMSEGTLRYLALLTILLHPDPPPLVCIEEPELGLHPDLIADLAGLLVTASSRSQIFVTTHSEHLIGALSGSPEAVIIAERGEQGTELRRLDPARLSRWLQKYTLGDLWRMGEIGGTRW